MLAAQTRTSAPVRPFVGTNSNKIHSSRHQPKISAPLSKAPSRLVHLSASSTEQASTSQASDDVSKALATLKAAAANSSASPVEVFQALRTLEQAKLPTEGWPELIGGTASPGKRWRLVFTSGTKEVQQAMKGIGQGGGKYFPLTAVQRWDASQGEIENGIFLGHIAALTFSGPYSFKGKKLQFDFDTLALRLFGRKFSFNLKGKITDYTPSPKDPFFLFFYVGEDLVAARGRSGGVAFWARTTSAWELEKGIL